MHQIALLLLTVAVAHASVTVTQVSNDGPHPSTMEIEVQLPDSNGQVRIPLTRTDAFEDIPMTVVEDGVSRTFSSHQVHHESHSHYRHIQSRSVISVRHVNGKRQISGHVMHDGTSYFLEPVGDSGHRVTKNVRNPEVLDKQVDLGTPLALSRRRRQSISSAATANTVDLYLLIDSTVWAAFTKIFGTESVALTELHYYYTHILNGIDTAYRNMGTPSISVNCMGITISKTAADDAWMPKTSLEGGDILKTMKAYIAGKTADHFMAFTRKDITGDGKREVCGMAYLGGACTANKVSINEDQGLQSWGTAAHELAHNLGSQHDSDGNSCTTATMNLMSPSSGFYDVTNVANSYQFSKCSKSYMSKYIEKLGTANCLVKPDGARLPDLSLNGRQGTRLTLDQVCKFTFPDSMGKFSPPKDTSNPAVICATIMCRVSATSSQSFGGLRAPVGTHCGSKMSCDWNGQCTADPQAPSDMTCFWGDTTGNCPDLYKQIAAAKNPATKAAYCKQVKPVCCRTMATLCP